MNKIKINTYILYTKGDYSMNKVYIDICDNFRLFLRINNKKLSNIKFKRKLLNLLFKLCLKLHIAQEKIYKRKRIIIIYMGKTKRKKALEREINKLLTKETNVILSKQILELIRDSKYKSIQNYFNKIRNNKENFNKEIINTIKLVINNKGKRIEEINIYLLIKNYNSSYNEKIIDMTEKLKSINIVTESIKEYKKLEEKLEDNITNITVTNNKRKGISNAKYIINIDYDEESLQRYSVYRNAIIFNISNNKISNIRGFEGIIINNIVVTEKDKSLSRFIDRRFIEIYDDNTEIIDILGNKGSIKNVLTK